MEKVLSVLWGEERFPLNLARRLPIQYKGDTSTELTIRTRRICCPNRGLHTLAMSVCLDAYTFTDTLLVGCRCDGRRISAQRLQPSSLETLFTLVWQFPDICRKQPLILPLLFEDNLITLVPHGDGFLLCAPSVDLLRERGRQVLVICV